MTVDIKALEFEPRRQTFSHIAARYGEDRPASRYDEATLDVQATANFHYRPLWQPEHEIFDASRTQIQMADWYAFKDPRQFYYATYNINRAAMNQAAERAFEFVEDRELVSRIDPLWLAKVRNYLVPMRHYEWGANLNTLFVTDFGYGTRFTSATMFAAGDRLGMAQILTRVGLVLDDYAESALDEGKTAWLEGEEWQPVRHMIEDSLVIEDWFENFIAQYLAMDGVMLPMVYGSFDEVGMDHGGTAVSMMSEFMVDWMKDCKRWVDSFVKTATSESEANAELISSWYATWRERAAKAAAPLSTVVLGNSTAVDDAVTALDARAAELGITI